MIKQEQLFASLIAELLILITCLVGDKLLASDKLLVYPWARALSDTFTHGLVALWSWAVVIQHFNTRSILEILLCGALGFTVDIDHFIAARSLHIHDATHLSHRPPFHNSTVIIVVTFLLWMFSHTMPPPPSRFLDHLPWIFFIAWSSHHIRDATRRGLWFWPIGSTSPLPKIVYILTIMVQALLMKIYWLLKDNDYKTGFTGQLKIMNV